VSITPDGRRAVSGSGDNTLIVWDLESGEKLKTLEGHTDQVNAVSITPDGRRAVSGSWDKTLIVWDLESGEKLKTLEGHTDQVKAVSITPDGRRAVSAAGKLDKPLILWDLERGEMLNRFFSTSAFEALSIYQGGIAAGGSRGKMSILQAKRELICPGTGFITVRRMWDTEGNCFTPFTADCPYCGHRFAPEKRYMDTINVILRNSNIGPDDSPCLKLPDEAWEEPKLLSECPKCKEKIRFNPFIVENKESWWKFLKK